VLFDVLQEMKMPDSQTFNSDVERTFSFLSDNGFSVTDRTDTPLTAGVTFQGSNVAVSLSLDRRDPCVDCYITRVSDGRLMRNDVSHGYWGPLQGFLIKNRGYRGGFKEFKIESEPLEWYQRNLEIYAAALRSLTPDIVQDSSRIFQKS